MTSRTSFSSMSIDKDTRRDGSRGMQFRFGRCGFGCLYSSSANAESTESGSARRGARRSSAVGQ
jgi:hypothetical protein